MPSTVTDYTSLYGLAQPELSGIPVPLLLQQFQITGRAFCRETEAWREHLSPVNIVAGSTRYALPMYYDVLVWRILKLWTNGLAEGARWSNPYEFRLIDGENVIVLTHAPTLAVANGLVAEVVLVPYLYSTELSPRFLEKWGEGIAAGVKSDLMAMPNKAWSNPQMSVYYKGKYDDAKAYARFENEHHGKKDTVTVHFNRWAM